GGQHQDVLRLHPRPPRGDPGERDGHDRVREPGPPERGAVQRPRPVPWNGAVRNAEAEGRPPGRRLAHAVPGQRGGGYRRTLAGGTQPAPEARLQEAVFQPAMVAAEPAVRAVETGRLPARVAVRDAGPDELLRARDERQPLG